jgi:hypothetical protein
MVSGMQSMNNLPSEKDFPLSSPLTDLPEDYQNPRIDMDRAAAGKYNSEHFQHAQERIAETAGRFLVLVRKPKFGWADYEHALFLGNDLIKYLVPAIEHMGANILKKIFKLILREALDADLAEGKTVTRRQDALQAICRDAKLPFEFKKEVSKNSPKYVDSQSALCDQT